ncbi:MAG TPA: hypothetical protein VKE93_11300 [Candidatus Angelobacter sp.]|nr:hypothetical protein [Candidatus Angelobacter sp.]
MIVRRPVVLQALVCFLALIVPIQPQNQPKQASPAPSAQATPSPEVKAPELPPTNDPKEIVRRSVEADHRAFELARSYTCQQREVEKKIGKHGEVKSTEIRTYDVNFYYGQEYSRLLQKDDKPLSDTDQKKEDEKLEKFLAKLRNQSEEEREKHAAKEKKQHEEERAFLRDMVNAFDFTLVGEEKVGGEDAWIIEATPRKDFHPTQPHGDILSKVKGKLWIEKKEYNWVKAEAETIDTISFGLFLFRIHKGTRLEFENLHLNNEVWLLRRLYINGGARLALLKNEAVEQEDTFSNYKKFATSSRILPGAKEVPEEKPQK